MPYKDVGRRRQFQREYKRKWRKAQEKINPLRAFKIYLCLRVPDLRMPGASFRDAFLITDDPETQARVERHLGFGTFIFPLALDLTCTPKEDEDAD